VVIGVYDILQSKEDKATVPIYCEARLAKIDLKPEERPKRVNPPSSLPANDQNRLVFSNSAFLFPPVSFLGICSAAKFPHSSSIG
jgi:hypothetical protein